MKSIFNFFTISCFFLISIIYNSVSIAQSSEGIEEIVVTARKKEENIQEMPYGRQFRQGMRKVAKNIDRNKLEPDADADSLASKSETDKGVEQQVNKEIKADQGKEISCIRSIPNIL